MKRSRQGFSTIKTEGLLLPPELIARVADLDVKLVGIRPEQCRLEKWAQEAREQGARALVHLREGVETAISALGSGFLAHPSNSALQARLASGELEARDYYRQLLRLVYRLIFLFDAEGSKPAPDRRRRCREAALRRLILSLEVELAATKVGQPAVSLLVYELKQEGQPRLGIGYTRTPEGCFELEPRTKVPGLFFRVALRIRG